MGIIVDLIIIAVVLLFLFLGYKKKIHIKPKNI